MKLKFNRQVKRTIFILLFGVSVLFLGACKQDVDYEFAGEKEDIVKIEIQDIGIVRSDTVDVRATYPIEDKNAFLEELNGVRCYEGEAHHLVHNSTVIRITYSSGKYEIIGSGGSFLLNAETGKLEENGMSSFVTDEFNALVAKYSTARYSGELTEYSFMQDVSEIEEIQLVDIMSRYGEIPIKGMEFYPIDDVEAFLSDFRKVECRMGGKPDLIREEKRIILVKYKNGEYEYIGAEGYLEYHHTWDTPVLSGTDCQCFDKEQFAALIEKYSPN